MNFLGKTQLGSLRHRGNILAPATRPWITDLSALTPYEGLEPGNLPEFERDPDWAAWELGDTPDAEADALKWLVFETETKRLLVADRMLMSRVSWADLDAAGYVFGRDITIDGKPWNIRLLTGGNAPADDKMAGAKSPNEWDTLLPGNANDAPSPTKEDFAQPLSEQHRNSQHNADWQWFGAVRWVQDTCEGRLDGRVCRGYHGPLYFYENTIDHRHEDIGWRPVLETSRD